MRQTVKNLKPARASSQTLTEAAEQEIRTAIVQGIYRPGTQLPAESELVEMLGVSRTVVREALRLLEDDGLITRRHGKGTFVRKRPILHNLNFNHGTTEFIRSAGLTPGTTLVKVQIMPAAQNVADALNLAVGAPVIAVERTRTADQKPVVYCWAYCSQSLVGDIQASEFRMSEEESLYRLLWNTFGIGIEYGVAQLLPVNASAPVAEKLCVVEGSVLLCLLQTDYSAQDEPVLYSIEYHLPDAFDFVIMRKGPRKIGSVSIGPTE